MKKNNVFRMIFAAALVFVLAFSFAACQATDTPSATDSSNEDLPTLVMATNAEFPPYEYYQGEQIVGIDADIAALIAEKLGMKLKIENMEFGAIIAAVQTGKVDMGMAGMTVDEERLQSVDFSTTYATGKQVIIVKEDSPITSADDFEGKTIGVQESTTGDKYVTWDYVDTGKAAIERYSKGADAVLALTQGKIHAVVIDNEPAKVFVSQNPGLKILETEYIVEDYAIAVQKGNKELLDKINKALAELKESGELQKIIDKYIKAE